MVLIVAEPSISGISDMERIINTAVKFEQDSGMYQQIRYHIENTEKIEEFCMRQGLPFIGRIPFDSNASKRLIMSNRCRYRLHIGTAVKEIYNKTMNLLFEKGGG